jgi:NAD-dependent deacetylase
VPDTRQHVVVLSGAGISAESGLGTFRGAGGLWEGYKISDVATPEGWERDFRRVLQFYNERRKRVGLAQPNEAHHALAALEEVFRVTIITQNIDDLHQRAGSTNVIHLHGEIVKARSCNDPSLVSSIGFEDIKPGQLASDGAQLRPFVVWFGEQVPLMSEAEQSAVTADFFIVVGTSLEVYPAASLVEKVPLDANKFLIDPNPVFVADESFHVVTACATEGVPRVCGQIRALMA